MDQSGNSYGAAVLRGLYAVVCSAMLLFVLETPAQAQSLLTRHVRPAVTSGQAKFLHLLPGAQSMRIDVVLPLSDPAGLGKFLQEVYDPASPSYRHFLTVPEFTARFGPGQEDYDAVVRYAIASGFKVVGGTRDGMDVQLEGSVTDIETTFNVSMGVYQHPTEERTFYAPDREPTVDLPFPLWHISGLDNYSIPHPTYKRRNPKSGNPTVRSNATTGSCPSASFCGSDMRAAYYVDGSSTATLTGAGQNIGLLEYYGYDIADLNTYYTNVNQTRTATVTGISTDGTSLTCLDSGTSPCDDTEQIIDMTQALGMAPGITTLYVYVGSTDTAILSAMTTDTPLPAQLGSSWTWAPADPSTDDLYFQKMAAQGQSFFQAAGDDGEWSSSNDDYPSEDANVICVGGTDLTTSSAGGPWSSETAWSDGGGGISPDDIAIPSWQQLLGVITSANEGSTVYRNGPDVSANANFTFYVCADQEACTANEYGGTSFAAPMWAGYIALANQQAAANGDSAVGFINPTIYPIGLSSSYDTDFHDITSGNNGFPAVVGYDLVTGWGSPNGANLINALDALARPIVNLSPGSVGFAIQLLKTASAAKSVTLSNAGSGSLTINSITIAGANSGDFTLAHNCALSPSTLASGAYCTLNATFEPTAAGPRKSSISISDSTGNSPQTVLLTGVGTAASLSPASLAFPSEPVGTASSAMVITLKDVGSATLDIYEIAIAGADPGDFSETTTCGSTLTAGSSCTVSVTFKPTASGARSASVLFSDNGGGSPQAVSLTGTGT